jgi:hypothetical protein
LQADIGSQIWVAIESKAVMIGSNRRLVSPEMMLSMPSRKGLYGSDPPASVRLAATLKREESYPPRVRLPNAEIGKE